MAYNQFRNHFVDDSGERTDYVAKGLSASVELGYDYKVSNAHRVIHVQPQCQLTYQGVTSGAIAGNEVIYPAASNWQTRVGLHVYTESMKAPSARFFTTLNWYRNSSTPTVTKDDMVFPVNGGKQFGEIKLGMERIRLGDSTEGRIQAVYQFGNGGYQDTSLQLGVRVAY